MQGQKEEIMAEKLPKYHGRPKFTDQESQQIAKRRESNKISCTDPS